MKNLVFVTAAIFFSLIMNAQDGYKEIFKIKYAALVTEFNPDGSKTVTTDNIEQFRAQYKRLQDGLKELDMFVNGGGDDALFSIYTMKEFKDVEKDNQITDLKKMMVTYSDEMKRFLGENDEYGIGKDDCLMTYSNLKQSINRKDYKVACKFWREMYNYFPLYKNAYAKGDFLIRTKINDVHSQAVDAYKKAVEAQKGNKIDEANKYVEEQKSLMAEEQLWIDSLLMIYDQRMKFLGDDQNYGTGYLKGKKGSYIYEYRKDSALDQAYELLKESVKMQMEKSLFTVVVSFFDASMDMVKAEKIEAEIMVDDYNLAVDVLKKSTEMLTDFIKRENAKSNPDAGDIKNWESLISNNAKASEYITKKFASSEFSTCEYLLPAFKKNFEKRKKDKDWLKTATGILSWKECTDDPFYGKAAEALYALEPSADAAFKLALFYLKKERYDDAAKYFEEAYTQEKDNEVKAEYYYYAAVVAFAQNKFSSSRSLALKAAGLKNGYGKPYVLIAKLYASSAGSCGNDKFEKSAVYWAAVDKLIKAKSIDPSVEDEANQLINKYSAYYPNSEEGFMRGIYKGDTYQVNCWIQETTTARY